MALPTSRWNGLCWVCGQGFATDDDLYIHVLIHPGRHPDDYQRAADARARQHAALDVNHDPVIPATD